MSRTVPDMETGTGTSAGRARGRREDCRDRLTDGMLHFELGIAYEVFGADLSHLVDPWYDVAVCGPGPSGSADSCWSPTPGSTGSRTPTP